MNQFLTIFLYMKGILILVVWKLAWAIHTSAYYSDSYLFPGLFKTYYTL
jgi:hypothetical protein